MKYTLSNQPVIIISIDQLTIHCNVPIVISYAYEYTLFFLLMKGSKKSVEIDTFATPPTPPHPPPLLQSGKKIKRPPLGAKNMV